MKIHNWRGGGGDWGGGLNRFKGLLPQSISYITEHELNITSKICLGATLDKVPRQKSLLSNLKLKGVYSLEPFCVIIR